MASRLFNERYPCPVCDRLHSIRECSHFLAMPICARREKVITLGLCRNCLAQSHRRPNCPSLDRCFVCRSNHHSLVHPMSLAHFWFQMTATARIFNNATGAWQNVRIMIDPTTKGSCVTMMLAEAYDCVIRHGYTTVRLRHRLDDNLPVEIRCALVNRRFDKTPKFSIETEWTTGHPIVKRNCVADPQWFSPQPYDLVLGSEVGSKVLRGGGAIGRPGGIYMQHTCFGLAFFGEGSPARRMEKK